jgi:hypothetical protein
MLYVVLKRLRRRRGAHLALLQRLEFMRMAAFQKFDDVTHAGAAVRTGICA